MLKGVQKLQQISKIATLRPKARVCGTKDRSWLLKSMLWFPKPDTNSRHDGNPHPIVLLLTLSRLVVTRGVFRGSGASEPTDDKMYRDTPLSRSWSKMSREVSAHTGCVWYKIRPSKRSTSTECFVYPDSYWFLTVSQQCQTFTPAVRHLVRFSRQQVSRWLIRHSYPPRNTSACCKLKRITLPQITTFGERSLNIV